MDALGVVVGRLGRLLSGLGRDGCDDQRGAVVVAGVVFAGRPQGGCRPARSLCRGRGWRDTRRPCGKSSFPSCGFSVPFFRFFRYSSKRESRSCPDISRCCICPVRSYWVSLSFVILVFRLCMLSICPRRPESREASDGGVLHRSIGIEPPRLHCGRAANYGGIIVPNTCRRLHREQPGFYRVSCIARSFLRSWRTHESGSGVQPIALGNIA